MEGIGNQPALPAPSLLESKGSPRAPNARIIKRCLDRILLASKGSLHPTYLRQESKRKHAPNLLASKVVASKNAECMACRLVHSFFFWFVFEER